MKTRRHEKTTQLTDCSLYHFLLRVWFVENGFSAAEGNGHGGSLAMNYFGPERPEQRLSVSPGDVSTYGILKDRRKNLLLFPVQGNIS
jgi:hypothetical protein